MEDIKKHSIILGKKIKKLVKTVLVQEVKLSRRIPGQFLICDSEPQGFKRIFCYVQKGINVEIKDLSRILSPIIGIQRNCFRNIWKFHLFSFGWEDEKLKKEEKGKSFWMNSSPFSFSKQILNISKSEKVGTALIPTFSKHSRACSQSYDDSLFLFISEDQIIFPEDYIKKNQSLLNIISKRSIQIQIINDEFNIKSGIE